MNPYQLPPAGSGLGPLCPHTYPEHANYYVPVDNTENSFQSFKLALGDARTLRSNGRLVVALGWDGCGKTSLLNRCAVWLKEVLGKNCHLGPVGMACRDHDTVEVRLRKVFQSLIHELGYRGLLTSEDRDVLTGMLEKNELDNGYFYVSRFVLTPRDAVLVLLLPRSEVVAEIENYAAWAHPNLVFLAESRFAEAVVARWPEIRGAHNPSMPVRLEVGALAVDDGWAFVQARKGDKTDALDYPFMTEETIRLVTETRALSIRELQDLLHGMYQELLERGRQPGAEDSGLKGEVTFHDLAKFHLGRAGWSR